MNKFLHFIGAVTKKNMLNTEIKFRATDPLTRDKIKL